MPDIINRRKPPSVVDLMLPNDWNGYGSFPV